MRGRQISLVLAGLAAFVGGFYTYESTRYSETRLTFLAVGQGDATVFQHGGRTMLIDCGPARDGYDAGERLVAPKLATLGVRTLDLVVLTHPDGDHIGGLKSVARRYRIGRVVVASCFRGHVGLGEALRAARVPLDRVTWIEHRQTVGWGEWSIRLDAPALNWIEDDNAGSLFVRVAGPGGVAQLTGDAPIEAEVAMRTRRGPWNAHVLKAGHHGAANSTGDAWLSEVRPRDVVISCGRDNSYGHPARSVMGRIRRFGARAHRTDRLGDVVFTPSITGWRIVLTQP